MTGWINENVKGGGVDKLKSDGCRGEPFDFLLPVCFIGQARMLRLEGWKMIVKSGGNISEKVKGGGVNSDTVKPFIFILHPEG